MDRDPRIDPRPGDRLDALAEASFTEGNKAEFQFRVMAVCEDHVGYKQYGDGRKWISLSGWVRLMKDAKVLEIAPQPESPPDAEALAKKIEKDMFNRQIALQGPDVFRDFLKSHLAPILTQLGRMQRARDLRETQFGELREKFEAAEVELSETERALLRFEKGVGCVSNVPLRCIPIIQRLILAKQADQVRIAELEEERNRLKKLLDRDHTGMASALNAIHKEVEGYNWIPAGEWGSYNYEEQTEDKLRWEVGNCFEQIKKIATKSLTESGTRAHAAFYPESDKLSAAEAESAKLAARVNELEAVVKRLQSGIGPYADEANWDDKMECGDGDRTSTVHTYGGVRSMFNSNEHGFLHAQAALAPPQVEGSDLMGFSRDNLKSPAARAAYDRQKLPQSPSPIAQRVRTGIRSSQQLAHEFLNVCEKGGMYRPELEFEFHPTRGWRFDVAFVRHKIAVEIQGGVFIQGRHNAPVSFIKEQEKMNAAAVLGWRIIYRTPSNFLEFETLDLVRRAMRGIVGR
jgi:hypothetical protein